MDSSSKYPDPYFSQRAEALFYQCRLGGASGKTPSLSGVTIANFAERAEAVFQQGLKARSAKH